LILVSGITAMTPLTVSLITFVCLSAGALSGFGLGLILPEHHLSNDSKDAIKMTWGILATMSALVLGLLVASAKNSFDTVNNEVTTVAAKILVLNHILILYGPQADEARNELHQAVASAIKRDWPDEAISAYTSAAIEKGNAMEGVRDKLNELSPATDAQRALLSQAEQISGDLMLARWLVIEEARTLLPTVLFVPLVAWLTLLFTGVGLLAPHNKTVLTASFLGSLSLGVAVFLINDLSHPLSGLITVSSAPMRDALEYLGQSRWPSI
jgi:Protein of unknown function (DUF4239)